MKKHVKTVFYLLLVLIAANVGLFFLNKQHEQRTAEAVKNAKVITVYQKIHFSAKNISDAKITAPEKATALETLIRFYTVETERSGKDIKVTAIKDKTGYSRPLNWVLFINGKQASISANLYILKDNDQIDWKPL